MYWGWIGIYTLRYGSYARVYEEEDLGILFQISIHLRSMADCEHFDLNQVFMHSGEYPIITYTIPNTIINTLKLLSATDYIWVLTSL